MRKVTGGGGDAAEREGCLDSDLPVRCQLTAPSPCLYSGSARILDGGELAGRESPQRHRRERRGEVGERGRGAGIAERGGYQSIQDRPGPE